MTAQERLIKTIESKYCPNSTDAGGDATSHYIREGACIICDRTVWRLAEMHGIA